MIPEDCDYTRFGGVAKMWPTPAAFMAGSWTPGVNVISMATAGHLDLYIHGNIDDHHYDDRTLPVIFSGAWTTRDGRPGPFLSGTRLGLALGTPFVAIADPTINHQSTLKLGWYTGRINENVQGTITDVLAAISSRTGRELLCVGGSGGGFAALHCAINTNTPTSALIWNPQTDILNYLQKPVAEFLETALQISEQEVSYMHKDDRSKALREGGIDHTLSLLLEAQNPKRLVYLQNSSDSHVRDHAHPFIERSGFQKQSQRIYTGGPNRTLWISDLAKGHAPPPRETIQGAVETLLDPQAPTSKVIDRLQRTATGTNAS